jgi:hypothetical protein
MQIAYLGGAFILIFTAVYAALHWDFWGGHNGDKGEQIVRDQYHNTRHDQS